MSHLFGPVRQLGYVIQDIDHAIDFWLNVMGCGPVFYVRSLRLEDHTYQGVASTPEIDLALLQNGDMQIELIQQHNDALSPYSAFLREHGEGLHHLGYWSETFEDDLARAQRHGMVVAQYAGRGKIGGLAARQVNFAPKGHPGTVIELSELRPGGTSAAFFRSVAQESRNWNGADPVRFVDLR